MLGIFRFKFLFLFLLILPFFAHSWGFWAHKKINRVAVFTLPPEMIKFYKDNIDYITKNATRPDMRRYAIKEEAPRHFLDADHYGENPFELLPRKWKDAVEKYTEDTLQAYGILPWHVNVMMYRLTDAFREKNVYQILKNSAEIGHYIGDAHVPLHTTLNYNGQLTNQKGIHGFWESRLPELYGDDYSFFVGRAEYLDYPLESIWQVIEKSFAALDSVLSFEKELSNSFDSDKKYGFESKGQNIRKVYSRDFSASYHQKLDGMVERRMKGAIITIGSFWFTAWVNAGQPDLNNFEQEELSAEEKEANESEKKSWEKGKIFGRQHE